MWEAYIFIAFISALFAFYFNKKNTWQTNTRQKYMELKDSDNYSYHYTPKERDAEKSHHAAHGSADSGIKTKFDGLFEYGRRENPNIDPEKQKQLVDEIERIKKEEREAKMSRPDNRIGGFREQDEYELPVSLNDSRAQTTPTTAPRSFEYTRPAYPKQESQNTFQSAASSQSRYSGFPSSFGSRGGQGFGSQTTSQQGTSSFFGSIVDTALEAKSPERETGALGSPVPERTAAWQVPQTPTEKPEEKKKEEKDKDWVPMGFFGK